MRGSDSEGTLVSVQRFFSATSDLWTRKPDPEIDSGSLCHVDAWEAWGVHAYVKQAKSTCYFHRGVRPK